MNVEDALFATVGPVFDGRFTPLMFPQEPNSPTWSAGRYTIISVDAATTVCGDSGDKGALTRVQIDIGARTYRVARALRLQVMAAMKAFPIHLTPTVAGNYERWESSIKVFLISIDFMLHGANARPSEDSPP